MARMGCDWCGRRLPAIGGTVGVGCSRRCVGRRRAAGGVAGGGAGHFGALRGRLLLLIIWFWCLVVTDSKMFEVVLPFPEQLSHVVDDVGDVVGRNGYVAARSSDIGGGLAEFVEAA